MTSCQSKLKLIQQNSRDGLSYKTIFTRVLKERDRHDSAQIFRRIWSKWFKTQRQPTIWNLKSKSRKKCSRMIKLKYLTKWLNSETGIIKSIERMNIPGIRKISHIEVTTISTDSVLERSMNLTDTRSTQGRDNHVDIDTTIITKDRAESRWIRRQYTLTLLHNKINAISNNRTRDSIKAIC